MLLLILLLMLLLLGNATFLGGMHGVQMMVMIGWTEMYRGVL
jgi:hypothetical protein